MRIAVATMWGGDYADLASFTNSNMIDYCERHGYECRFILLAHDERWEYRKHEAFKVWFEQGIDLIWYKDIDSLITNMSKPIPQNFDGDFAITRDFNELNGGSILIRNTPVGHAINSYILADRNNYENEQNVFNSDAFQDCFYKRISHLPQSEINSYRYDLYPECKSHVGREDLGDWVEGKSFVLHVPGLSLEKRLEVLRNTKITE